MSGNNDVWHPRPGPRLDTGRGTVPQLENLTNATDIELAQADIDYLEELYQPLESLLSLGMS